MADLREFFLEIDRRWKHPGSGKIPLRIIGCSALLLQTDYDRGTKDSDVLETLAITPDIKKELLDLAGEDTDFHKRYRMYVEVVPNGLPFLPQPSKFHPLPDLNRSLKHFEIEVLDIVDVVVSKLARLHADDVKDIRGMIDRKLATHAKLVEHFKSAMEYHLLDARADKLPKYIQNLNRIERDFLRVPESKFDLPDWVSD